MVIIKIIYLIGGICLILGGLIYLFFRHQRRLKARAFLMREAVRNGDYAFRLPTSGLLPGERALQQALNDMQGDIARLVARHEVESWQKLTRVLTHEIMNATAPISSICQAYLSTPQIKGSEYEEGIQAIHDTSKSLTNFVDSYRKLTQLQAPVVEPLTLASFLESIRALYPDLNWHIFLPQNVTLEADRNMLRQVFINLTKNAIEAHATDIDVRMSQNERPVLLFSNNGAPHPCRCGTGNLHPILHHQIIRHRYRPIPLPPDADDAEHRTGTCRHFHLRLPCNILPGKTKRLTSISQFPGFIYIKIIIILSCQEKKMTEKLGAFEKKHYLCHHKINNVMTLNT